MSLKAKDLPKKETARGAGLSWIRRMMMVKLMPQPLIPTKKPKSRNQVKLERRAFRAQFTRRQWNEMRRNAIRSSRKTA